MARIFIAGSAGGLGPGALSCCTRNEVRARDTRMALPGAEAVLVGDLSTIAAMRSVAAQANRLGCFDAVIHNVGIGYREPRRVVTEDGLSQLWAVNVLAPYVLTALTEPLPTGAIIPNSAMCARVALVIMTRCRVSISRTLCSIIARCSSGDFDRPT